MARTRTAPVSKNPSHQRRAPHLFAKGLHVKGGIEIGGVLDSKVRHRRSFVNILNKCLVCQSWLAALSLAGLSLAGLGGAPDAPARCAIPERLHPPLVTPFRDGSVDYDSYAALVEFQAANGSHGVLVNGTTSEPASLTIDERNRLVDVAVEAARGRLTVVAATGSQSYAETETLTCHAAGRKGVDALLIVTPYYSRPPQRGIVEYYRQLNGLHRKPWMIYHIPGRAAVDVKLDTVKEIDRCCPTFAGMKHASLDLGFVSDVCRK
jgi:hypothetical protein